MKTAKTTTTGKTTGTTTEPAPAPLALVAPAVGFDVIGSRPRYVTSAEPGTEWRRNRYSGALCIDRVENPGAGYAVRIGRGFDPSETKTGCKEGGTAPKKFLPDPGFVTDSGVRVFLAPSAFGCDPMNPESVDTLADGIKRTLQALGYTATDPATMEADRVRKAQKNQRAIRKAQEPTLLQAFGSFTNPALQAVAGAFLAIAPDSKTTVLETVCSAAIAEGLNPSEKLRAVFAAAIKAQKGSNLQAIKRAVALFPEPAPAPTDSDSSEESGADDSTG